MILSLRPCALAPLALAWASFALCGQDLVELRKLDLDTLIDRLPRTKEQWVRKQGEPGFEPHRVAAEMADRLHAGVTLSDEQWRRALLRTGAVRLRERWPAGQPFAVSMREAVWLNEAAIELVPRNRNLEPARMTPFTPHCNFAAAEAAGVLEIPLDELVHRERTVAPDGRGPWWPY